nr:mucin-7-like [Aegilops tauschii subsp. strangulata]
MPRRRLAPPVSAGTSSSPPHTASSTVLPDRPPGASASYQRRHDPNASATRIATSPDAIAGLPPRRPLCRLLVPILLLAGPRRASPLPLPINAGEDPFVLPFPLPVVAVATLIPSPLALNTTQATSAPSSSRPRLRRTRRPVPRELRRACVAILVPVSPLVTHPPCPDRDRAAPPAVMLPTTANHATGCSRASSPLAAGSLHACARVHP